MTPQPTPLVVETEPERVARLLRELGDCSYKVAAALMLEQCAGERGEASACPIFRFLAANAVDVTGIGTNTVLFLGHDAQCLPPAVRSFVASFDQGAFPALVLA